jgi:CheY-like chemotaxis protein
MRKILLVDDVPGWVRFHRANIEYLNIGDVKIEEAFSAKEALSKIESSIDNPYCAIFTDLQMESDFLPYLAGEWLVKQIKTYDKYYKNTNIVIVSASPSIEQIAKRNDVYFIPKNVIRNADAEIYKQYIMQEV